MTSLDISSCYRAFSARDARFDGVFFTRVVSTGIYCRPICPAKVPKEKNCRFFASAEAAEKAGFRPCLRCRPELAPGLAPADDAQRIAQLIARRIEEGLIEPDAKMADIAAQFELSERQIRRILQKELGVSPIELISTRRLLLAKQLLTETALPVTDIAYASGFSSLRRFNDAFSRNYGMPPTQLRKLKTTAGAVTEQAHRHECFSLQLSYRLPYDWDAMLSFLGARRLTSVESVGGDFYARTVRIGPHKGWVEIRKHPDKDALIASISHSLMPVLPAVLSRLRHLLDLNARPDVIAAVLARDPLLKKAVRANPGLRVAGAFDGFELAVRAILGQQVTVKAATTLARRFCEAFGEKMETPYEGLSRLSPVAERVAKASGDEIARLGIVSGRAKSIIALASAVASGKLKLEAGADPESVIAQLVAIPGIGQWTAHYIAMRALRWPDAFPKEDIAIRNRIGGVSARAAEEKSQAWRPWRSYAVIHIWQMPVSKEVEVASNRG